ncbi:unnamed protein product [Merluccius merluccius]
MSFTDSQHVYRTLSVRSEPSTLRAAVPAAGGSYETQSVRYLVPVQQHHQQQQRQYMVVGPQVGSQVGSQVIGTQVIGAQMMPQMMTTSQVMPQMMTTATVMPQVMTTPVMPQVMPQMLTPMYVQNIPRISVSSLEGSDFSYQIRENGCTSPRVSVVSSPIKSPDLEEVVVVEETEIINVIKSPAHEQTCQFEWRSQTLDRPQPVKMDTRYFGELLAEVYRKNCNIHSCIAEHVAKIGGRKHQQDVSNVYKDDREEVEAYIPKGASELTKQQIRYLLQTRLTADRSMRLLLSTFSSLREELLHMSDDLRRLESDKESLERDLSFKTEQSLQYDRLLENVRESNRQLQVTLKESSVSQRSLESQLMSSKTVNSGRDFKMKELEGRLRALEQENDMLRHKVAGHGSSSATLQLKTEQLAQQYQEQLNALKQEKEKEVQILQTQLSRVHTEVTTVKTSSDQRLQLKISELTSELQQRQRTITHLEQEIKKLRLEMSDSSRNITKTTITKKYRNQYPILGLLSDDYLLTSPIKEAKTIVIEKTGEIYKQSTGPVSGVSDPPEDPAGRGDPPGLQREGRTPPACQGVKPATAEA